MSLSAFLGRGGKQRLKASDAASPRSMQIPSDNSAFDAALRHSRRVRLMRKFIPVGCAAALVGPIAWGIISPFARTVPDIRIGAISVSGSKITMESPKLSGFKKDLKSYEVTAREAIQDIKAPSIVELNQLTGRMEQEKNSFARLTSDWGKFDQGADRLDLKGNVRVRTDSGYEVDMLSAQVNMKSGDIVSLEPVTVRSKTGTISANQVDVKDNAKVVIFEGRVRSVFVPAEEPVQPVKESKTQ
ncbi:MAG: LPS export ABC transporter periplasmic protein LptC [Beijerinckiaceae bacterium]